MRQILLLEDEEILNTGIRLKLEKEGYHVFSCAGIKEGRTLFHNNDIDLVICDVLLEDGNGLDFCKVIRQQSDVQFIFLTAMDQEVDILMGYEVGADDYITKPFSLTVLLSKVAAIIKRIDDKEKGKKESGKIVSGNICFYSNEMRVLVEEDEKYLTKNELKLLYLFMEHPKQILSKKQILESLFDVDGEFVDENTVAVNIKRLREKIEEDPKKPVYIKNIRGIGYLWDKERR